MKEIKRLLHKNLFIFSIVFLILSAFSCKNISVPVQVTSANTPYAEFVQIRASIVNYNQVRKSDASLYSSPSGARSINPTLQANDYDFYLFGQKRTNDWTQTFGPVQVQVSADANGDSGSFATQIPPGTWYLTLAAFKTETPASSITGTTLSSSALLIGHTLVEFSKTNSNASFTLSASGLTTPGKVNLKINLEDWKLSDFENEMKVKAELINTKTGIALVSENDINKANDTYFYFSPDTDINPGIYLFKLTFYNFTKTAHSFTWSDKLTVYPGTDTKQDVYVPKVMNTAPESPTSISFNITAADKALLTTESNLFPCSFEWTAPPSTAQEYVLTLTDENRNSLTYDSNVLKSLLYRSGGLSIKDSSINLWVPMGHRYKVALYSKNITGSSEKVIAADTLNLHKITYNLQGGTTLSEIFGSGTSSGIGPYTFFFEEGDDIWKAPTEDDIKIEGKKFTGWTIDPAGNTTFDSTTYDGFSNLELYGKYEDEDTVTTPLRPGQTGSITNLDGTSTDYSIEFKYSETDVEYDNAKVLLEGNRISGVNKENSFYLYIQTTNFKYESIIIKLPWNENIFNFDNPTIDNDYYKYGFTFPGDINSDTDYELILEASYKAPNGNLESSQFKLILHTL